MRAAATRTVRAMVIGTIAGGVMATGVAMSAGLAHATGSNSTHAGSDPMKVISNPTKAQIRTAIKHAESSKLLWATVNICSSNRYPDTLGVRGQMPALGFASWLSLSVQVNYFSKAKQRFEPSLRATKLIRLGRTATQVEQGGQTFSFPPQSGLLNATIEFRWRRSGKLLGHAVRRTTAGHPSADFGSPPHYSAKQCTIP